MLKPKEVISEIFFERLKYTSNKKKKEEIEKMMLFFKENHHKPFYGYFDLIKKDEEYKEISKIRKKIFENKENEEKQKFIKNLLNNN